jgi:hypothetical protein
MNWNTQPSSDAAVISAAQAPAVKDAWVSWNVTSAVQGWVNGENPNYGFMIRIQTEKTGVANEASGFYSRQYPKEILKPKLRVFSQNNPPFTYLSTVRVSGLPTELSSVVTADDAVRIQVSGEGAAYFLFESGTEHVISADEYVNSSESVRYHAKGHSIVVNAEGEFTVTYEPQFLIIVRSEPAGLIQREWSQWYDPGARVETPPAREIAEQREDVKIALDGWYINDARQAGNQIEVVVNGPATITARYATLYNVTVSSPYGKTSGSGWHPTGSSVEISVTPTYLPAEGMLGYLGIGMTFDHWSGSFENTSPTTTITVNGPIQAQAVWREDRSRLVLEIAILIGIVLVLFALRMRSRRSSNQESMRRPMHASKGRASHAVRLSTVCGLFRCSVLAIASC